MGETRVVKRYANRKLYDTQRSRYVTLEQIAEMIRSGEDVKIVDNNTKEDLTALTLTQIIFEQEKKGGFLPLSALRNIMRWRVFGGLRFQYAILVLTMDYALTIKGDTGPGICEPGTADCVPDRSPHQHTVSGSVGFLF